MKTALLLFVLFSVSFAAPPAVRVTFSPLTKAAYLQAEKARIETKPQVTFPLKKQGGRIVIPTAKGNKVFKDVVITEASLKLGHGDEEETSYSYLGYLTDYKCHLVQVTFYETQQWLLVDKSGRQIALWGEPVFSPDKQTIVAICMGIDYGGGQPNIIQLVALEKGVLRQVWSLEPKTWEPAEISWASDKTLLLQKLMWTKASYGTVSTYAKLTITP